MYKCVDELSEPELIRAIIIIDNNKLKLGYLDNDIVEHVETFTTDAQWNEWVENINKARLFVHLVHLVHLMNTYKPMIDFFNGYIFSIVDDKINTPESLTGREYTTNRHMDCQMALYKAVVMYHLGYVIRINIDTKSIYNSDWHNHV